MRRYLFLKSSAPTGREYLEAVASALPRPTFRPKRRIGATLLTPPCRSFTTCGMGPAMARPKAWRWTLPGDLGGNRYRHGRPLYWFSPFTAAKLYLDHWSHWMRLPDLNFKPLMWEKTMWLVMAHASSSPEEIAPAVGTLRLSAEYLGMAWGGALLVDANAPGAWAEDTAAVERAKGFFPA